MECLNVKHVEKNMMEVMDLEGFVVNHAINHLVDINRVNLDVYINLNAK
jgi:hypothetical protein